MAARARLQESCFKADTLAKILMKLPIVPYVYKTKQIKFRKSWQRLLEGSCSSRQFCIFWIICAYFLKDLLKKNFITKLHKSISGNPPSQQDLFGPVPGFVWRNLQDKTCHRKIVYF